MRGLLVLVAACLAPSAAAQVMVTPPVTSQDMSALLSLIPQPAETVQPMETVGGAIGNSNTYRRGDAAPNRITRTGTFTVGANGMVTCSGSITCTWDVALPAGAASYPMFFTGTGAAGSMTIRCMAITSTNVSFSAQCRHEVVSVAILGAAVSILAPSGTTVYAIALPATQPNR